MLASTLRALFRPSRAMLQEQRRCSLAPLATPSKVITFSAARTRISHNLAPGRAVTRLEYQAYTKLAIQTMAGILRAAAESASRSDHQLISSTTQVAPLTGCALWHRLGTVPVGEPSIVIAVSSPHRKEAFQACEFILEEVKLKAQIWKREYFEGDKEENAQWKSNSGG